MLNEYINVIGNLAIGVDVLCLLGVFTSLFINVRALLFPDYKLNDVDFRFLMLSMCIVFILANLEALNRHYLTLIVIPSKLTQDTLDSLIRDRAYMFATSCFMVLLSIKYRTEWFHR